MPTRRCLRLIVAVMAVAMFGAACASVSGFRSARSAIPAEVVSDRLLFGRVIVTGGSVTDAEWATFLDEVITPRLPDGFSVARGTGQWRTDGGLVARDSGFVLEVVHPPGSLPDSIFAEIAAEYCRRFRQESVLRVRSAAQEWVYRGRPH